jgi:hypothetical protein
MMELIYLSKLLEPQESFPKENWIEYARMLKARIASQDEEIERHKRSIDASLRFTKEPMQELMDVTKDRDHWLAKCVEERAKSIYYLQWLPDKNDAWTELYDPEIEGHELIADCGDKIDCSHDGKNHFREQARRELFEEEEMWQRGQEAENGT